MSEVTQLTPPELAPPIGQAGHGAGDGFHPAVAEWLRRRFPDGPTEAQAPGWPHIPTGADTLTAAPTGSGQTLAVARDKRGSHLALTLERLEALCDRRPARIGLSATQRPIERVGRLLVGERPLPEIVDVGHQRALDVTIELPEGELEAVASAEQMSDVINRIAEHVTHHQTTLVFVNTRRMAERLAHQLGERLGDDVVAAHHGSLSKERRWRGGTPAAARAPQRPRPPP